MTPRSPRKLADAGRAAPRFIDEDLIGRFMAEDFVELGTGEVDKEAGDVTGGTF